MTVLVSPPTEQVWTCDADGNWRQEPRVRIRHGNGYREVRVVDNLDDLLEAVHAAGAGADSVLDGLKREHEAGRIGDVLVSGAIFSDREVI